MEYNTPNVEALGRKFRACQDAIDWANRECKDAAAIWRKADPTKLLWVATRPGVLTDQELTEFVQRALVETPVSDPQQLARIRACLDGSDRLNYSECSRALWAACAVACWGRVPNSDRETTRLVQAAILRRVCPQPFADEAPRK